MATPVYNRFNITPSAPITIDGDSAFVPDMAMSIQEIIQRAQVGVLSDFGTQPEIPDYMADYYEDLVDGLEPLPDDFGDDFADLSDAQPE